MTVQNFTESESSVFKCQLKVIVIEDLIKTLRQKQFKFINRKFIQFCVRK